MGYNSPIYIFVGLFLFVFNRSDLYDQFNGDPYSHAYPFARIMEEGLAASLTQVGIRTLTQHQREQAEKFGVNIFPMNDWKLQNLPKFRNPLYLSLDLDALDPAYAPGVSHHEPGGFSTRDILSIIQRTEASIIGADLVEFNPDRDINGMTAIVCAKFLREIASRMLLNKPGL
jgi:arginase family enzyme